MAERRWSRHAQARPCPPRGEPDSVQHGMGRLGRLRRGVRQEVQPSTLSGWGRARKPGACSQGSTNPKATFQWKEHRPLWSQLAGCIRPGAVQCAGAATHQGHVLRARCVPGRRLLTGVPVIGGPDAANGHEQASRPRPGGDEPLHVTGYCPCRPKFRLLGVRKVQVCLRQQQTARTSRPTSPSAASSDLFRDCVRYPTPNVSGEVPSLSGPAGRPTRAQDRLVDTAALDSDERMARHGAGQRSNATASWQPCLPAA